MNTSSLLVENTSKNFAGFKAVDDVTFDLNAGERVALLGHNGAGKTTLFKMILGFLRRDGGRISVLGAEPGSHAARSGASYLPEAVAFPGALTGKEVLTFYARLKGEKPALALPLLERVGLADAAGRKVSTYSKGMRQRLGLAQALIGQPKLVLLDEPTTGLDPISRQNVYELIGEIAAKGATVLLSSHALTELEAKTDRILILSKGCLVADDQLNQLREQAGLPIRLKIWTKPDAVQEVANQLGSTRMNGRSVELDCTLDEKIQALSAISSLGNLVEDVDVHAPSLDDVYRHFSNTAQKEA
ncbi:MAG: ABC transporter ATP-binding protein [Roseibium sp.]|uniref:ABC transporter ATP-binding protein n=1 Tax=Roseibium sp. TaxID=1936156 RepID=UPI001B1DFBA1|nr:ABC transporter ATP-binding protein [Roseibium sp.]MBO6895256.1 ABC transporter ATP-binding protein [Roseibium sp.]MBO6929808.1 ABC transporter ATP-binding protein [Roseibium sp.]